MVSQMPYLLIFLFKISLNLVAFDVTGIIQIMPLFSSIAKKQGLSAPFYLFETKIESLINL